MQVKLFRIAAVATVLLLSNRVSLALEEIIWRSDPTPAAQAEFLFKQYKSFMLVTVDRIDRACKLTKAQKSRLTTASKRAIGKWKEQRQKRRSGRLRQLGQVPQFEVATRMTTLAPSHPPIARAHWDKDRIPSPVRRAKSEAQGIQKGRSKTNSGTPNPHDQHASNSTKIAGKPVTLAGPVPTDREIARRR